MVLREASRRPDEILREYAQDDSDRKFSTRRFFYFPTALAVGRVADSGNSGRSNSSGITMPCRSDPLLYASIACDDDFSDFSAARASKETRTIVRLPLVLTESRLKFAPGLAGG